RLIAAAPSLFVEGRLGPIVTCVARAGQARALAALPLVSTVRLPRPARPAIAAGIKTDGDNARALAASGLAELHKHGCRGRGVRVAVIDADFSGYEQLVKAKRLPANTRYIDLTAERSYDLLPEPPAEEPNGPGHGARCALAVALAAPEAELTLIRIDPAAPYQLQTLAEYLNGEAGHSQYLIQRRSELVTESALLRLRRSELLKERQQVLENYEDEKNFEREYGMLGMVGEWLFSPRRWHARRVEEFGREVAAHRERELRYLKLAK